MIKIGSRKSPLAMRQAEEAAAELKRAFPDETIEIIGISTKGDREIDRSLKSFGGKGVFIKELESALLSGEIDAAVHSAKDMPTELPGEFAIGAVIKRGSPEDVLVTLRDNKSPKIIGTGSARREIQLRELYSDVQIKPIRGNIHTRIEKLKNGEYDAVVIAKAAIERLGIADKSLSITELDFVCAAGQGVIALEIKASEIEKYAPINDKNTFTALIAEREFLRLLGGGCHSPAGAYAVVKNGKIIMETIREKDGKPLRRKASGTDPLKLAYDMIREEEK